MRGIKPSLVAAIALACSGTTAIQTSPATDVTVDLRSIRLSSPRLVITKKERKLDVFDGETLVKSYKAVLGFAPEGHKQRRGDGKTPEGDYFVAVKNDKSRYYLSLGLSYPSIRDAEAGLAAGLIDRTKFRSIATSIRNGRMPRQDTALGGDIYIHGGGTSSDWTLGCIALENHDIRELFETIPIGTKVSILP